MKNGYTPKEYAYSIAVDALYSAAKNWRGEMEGLAPYEREQALAQIEKLYFKLAQTAKLEPSPI